MTQSVLSCTLWVNPLVSTLTGRQSNYRLLAGSRYPKSTGCIRRLRGSCGIPHQHHETLPACAPQLRNFRQRQPAQVCSMRRQSSYALMLGISTASRPKPANTVLTMLAESSWAISYNLSGDAWSSNRSGMNMQRKRVAPSR